MGAQNAKENLYSAIEAEDIEQIKLIIKANPYIINEPMTDDCKSTPIERAALRGSVPILKVLVDLGADVNYPGVKGFTALISASRRYQETAVDYLIEKGADIDYISPDNMKAIDYAVLHGSYSIAMKFMRMGQSLKSAEEYEIINQRKNLPYFDYKLMLKYLEKEIPANSCPPFYIRPLPKKKTFNDPVIDPRETWTEFFKRMLEFEDPPLVERNELPVELQPQNRFFSKMRDFFNRDIAYNVPSSAEKQDTKSDKNLDETSYMNKKNLVQSLNEEEEVPKSKDHGSHLISIELGDKI